MTGVFQSENIDQLAAALAAAQDEIENPVKDRENPHFRSRYADLASVLNATRKPLAKNGLSVVQVGGGTYDQPTLRTTLLHKSGQWIAGEVPLNGDLTKPQALGSLITYMRRYTLAAIAGVAQEDDDGEGATAHGPVGNGNGNRPPSTRPASPPPRTPPAPSPASAPRRTPAPTPTSAPSGSTPAPDMSRKPTSGKGMYAWSKQAGDATGFDWTGEIIRIGKSMGFPAKTYDWQQPQIDAVWGKIQEFLGSGDEPASDDGGADEDGDRIPF